MANAFFELETLGLIIEEKLGENIKLYPLATKKVLAETAGAIIAVPVTKYIEEAVVVAAGQTIPETEFTQEEISATVKKIGKHIKVTQEEVNNAYINVHEEVEKQLLKAIEGKIEKEMFAELEEATLTATVSELNVEGLADALVPFGEEIEEAMYLFVNPAQLAGLRKDPDFIVNANHGGKVVGSAGMIFGMEVIVSRNVEVGKAFIVKEGALAIFIKKGVELEQEKDIVTQTYHLVATQHYVTKLVDHAKAIYVTIGEEEEEVGA